MRKNGFPYRKSGTPFLNLPSQNTVSTYKNNKTICGIKLPNGLKKSDKLEKPLFTPSTKVDKGHDINISFDEMKKIMRKEKKTVKDIIGVNVR